MVVPTYNERANVDKLIPIIREILDNNDYEGYIVVVDDNSPDGTFQVVNNFCRNFKNVFLIRRRGRRGLGSACEDGLRFSVDKINVDIIITMDADFSHNPSYIPQILKKMDDYDIIIGSRYIPGGRVKDWSSSRILISRIANSLVQNLLNMELKDITSNFRAYSSKVIETIDFSKIDSKDFSFVPELLYKCLSVGFKVGEVPITYVERRLGKSKLDVRGILSFIKTIFKLTIMRILKRQQ